MLYKGHMKAYCHAKKQVWWSKPPEKLWQILQVAQENLPANFLVKLRRDKLSMLFHLSDFLLIIVIFALLFLGKPQHKFSPLWPDLSLPSSAHLGHVLIAIWGKCKWMVIFYLKAASLPGCDKKQLMWWRSLLQYDSQWFIQPYIIIILKCDHSFWE